MGTISNYDLAKDVQGDLSINMMTVPMYVDDYVMAAGTPQTVTIPTGANYVRFGNTGTFYARWDGTASAVPGANVTGGSGSEVNPDYSYIQGKTSFSIVAPAICVISCSYYM